MDRQDAARTAPAPPGGPGGTGAPRQEYVDAFSAEQYGRPLPVPGPRGAGESAGPGEPGPVAERGRAPGPAAAPDQEPDPAPEPEPVVVPEEPRAGREPEPEPAHRPQPGAGRHRGARRRAARSGGWGRTVTGAAAAAVAAVLTVVVAGETHGPAAVSGDGAGDSRPHLGQQDLSPRESASGGEGAGATPEREPEPDPELGYDELMDSRFPLDPDLTGGGELVPVGGSEPAADPDAVTLLRYRVDVEAGIGLDPELFAEAVHRTLSDPRSWGNNGERGFARVSSGDYDFVITLASPGTTAEWCDKSGLDIRATNVSCDSASTERVMINAWRWAQGAETYGDDMHAYRQMLINHEVGHRIGYGHVGCSAEGAPAPVMMQQTKFLTWTNGLTCTPNPWPHPENDAGSAPND
ncbi:DUF3152 domain-containing protein [Streptomyces sp. NPDC059853]|uniref:DUF3152 domain-containing protein n=1 Tax=Streptomyces sp. NPDC059853 TaxID=3346973 RepID=UPI0036645B72